MPESSVITFLETWSKAAYCNHFPVWNSTEKEENNVNDEPIQLINKIDSGRQQHSLEMENVFHKLRLHFFNIRSYRVGATPRVTKLQNLIIEVSSIYYIKQDRGLAVVKLIEADEAQSI